MRSEEASNIFGMSAENYFRSILNKFGVQYNYEDSWFDFLINKKYKVEVKSCQLAVKDGKVKDKRYRVGRFDFTKKENRELQFKENIWIVFILRHESNFLLLGFTRAKYLQMRRYVPLYDLRKLSMLNFREWILQVNKK